MLKENKRNLLISSAVILLPVVFGLIFWDKLPEQMATHWGFDGQADGWSSRGFTVFALPLLMLALHWLCAFVTSRDPKNQGQNKKVFGIVLWITPLVSVFANGMTYAAALGKTFQPFLVTDLLLGAVFVIVGNYLPKCRQNHTIGIKVKWTLENEENWNATHRFAGKVWVIGGLVLIACAFLPDSISPLITVASVVVLAAVPIVYSYLYHRMRT